MCVNNIAKMDTNISVNNQNEIQSIKSDSKNIKHSKHISINSFETKTTPKIDQPNQRHIPKKKKKRIAKPRNNYTAIVERGERLYQRRTKRKALARTLYLFASLRRWALNFSLRSCLVRCREEPTKTKKNKIKNKISINK